jgi:hypothetical protein
VQNLIRIGAKGLELKEDWLFITFGVKGVKLDNPDILNGILITTDTKVTELSNFIKKIEDNVYLIDLVL